MAEKQDKFLLSADEKEKIVEYINEKTNHANCSVCGNEHLMLVDHLVTPMIVSPSGGLSLGGTNYPLAMTVCDNCQHIQFFAAVPMGIMREREKPVDDDNG